MRAETEQAATQWLANKRGVDDPRSLALIVARAEQLVEERGGCISLTHFEVAYLQLLNEHAIPKFSGSFRDKPEKQPVPQDVIDYIEHTPAREARRRYNSDPIFRAQYDAYESSKRTQQQQQATDTGTLTADAYRRIPAATIARKYQTDLQFRAQVDALIKRGEI